MPEDSPLHQSLGALSTFFVGDSTVADTLLRVSELAVAAVAPAQYIGLTMLVDDKPTTAVFTDPDSPEIDQAQYRSGKGPCLDAFRTGEIQAVPSTERANPWPEFSQACREHQILSTLSLPMGLAGRQMGAMNCYAAFEDAFDGPAIETATLFASQASIVLANADAYWQARTVGEQLSESIAHRDIIEQAKGIIMSSMRCDADQAFH
jgi:GAF domain-containing protein